MNNSKKCIFCNFTCDRFDPCCKQCIACWRSHEIKPKETPTPKCLYCYDKGYCTVAVEGDFIGDKPFYVPFKAEKRPCPCCQELIPKEAFGFKVTSIKGMRGAVMIGANGSTACFCPEQPCAIDHKKEMEEAMMNEVVDELVESNIKARDIQNKLTNMAIDHAEESLYPSSPIGDIIEKMALEIADNRAKIINEFSKAWIADANVHPSEVELVISHEIEGNSYRDSYRMRKMDVKKISDGYHTFEELYEHRITLFVALCRKIAREEAMDRFKNKSHELMSVWRSRLHSDGTMFKGSFILGMKYKKGKQITYHLPITKWEETNFAETLENAPEWDGHTPQDVIKRISEL